MNNNGKIKQPQLNLRKVMNKKNVGDQWLANQIGVSRQSVSKIINGHTDPPLSRLYEIADALGVMITDLFG
jgi:DNA-binding XRE family transcriptional regulator